MKKFMHYPPTMKKKIAKKIEDPSNIRIILRPNKN